MNYEQAIAELQKILTQLEDENVKLEQALYLFEKSINLSKICFDKLNEAEGKIIILKKQLDEIIEVPFSSED